MIRLWKDFRFRGNYPTLKYITDHPPIKLSFESGRIGNVFAPSFLFLLNWTNLFIDKNFCIQYTLKGRCSGVVKKGEEVVEA